MKATSKTEYFASTEDMNQLANSMQEKMRAWRRWCGELGLISLWNKKLSNYYGISAGGNSSQRVTAGGSEGELALIKVNDLHSLIQEQLVTVTSQRPAGVAKAINSDTESMKAARIGTGISEYYMSQANFEAKFVQVTEIALLLDEGFLDLFWDKAAGDPIAVDPDTHLPEMSGDAVLRVHSPWNVCRDPGIPVDSNKWYIVSYIVNKFDAAGIYPKFADRIIAATQSDMESVPMDTIPDDSDAIYAHLLVHDRTAAVPNGRYSLMIADEIVLDTALPFKDFPVERIAATDVIDSCIGYAPANDILALEEVTDALHSVITTNQVTFGGQCIVGPEGSNLKQSDLGKGVRYFELPPDMVDKLRPLQLTKTPPEVFNYIQVLGEKKGKAVGSVSQTLTAQATQGASGSSMALIQSQSIAYNSGIQRAYFRLLSSTMTKLIGILRVYADTPRVARIVGKSKASGLKEFKYTGKDLQSISSIVYEMVNPVSQTFGGRLSMAQDLLKAGQVKSPKQYINMVATGQMDVLVEDDEADGMIILEENEWLSEGRPFEPVITQNHEDHIKSHASQITLEAQQTEPDFVARVLDHIQGHIDIWQQASQSNPGILIATKQQPLPPPPQPQPQGPDLPPPSTEGHQAGPPGPAMPKLVGGGGPGVLVKAGETKQPQLPNIAGTDQKPTIPGVTDAGLG